MCYFLPFFHWLIFNMQISDITDFFSTRKYAADVLQTFILNMIYNIKKNESSQKMQTHDTVIEINDRTWYDLCTIFPYRYLNSTSSTTYLKFKNHNIIFHDYKYDGLISLRKCGVIFQFRDQSFYSSALLRYNIKPSYDFSITYTIRINNSIWIIGMKKMNFQNKELILTRLTSERFMNVIPVEYPCYPCK